MVVRFTHWAWTIWLILLKGCCLMQAASFLRSSMKLNFTFFFFSLSVTQIKKLTGTVVIYSFTSKNLELGKLTSRRKSGFKKKKLKENLKPWLGDEKHLIVTAFVKMVAIFVICNIFSQCDCSWMWFTEVSCGMGFFSLLPASEQERMKVQGVYYCI